MRQEKPIVVITGRPNVGKSTFFNRVTKTKNAIVDNFPGITRDRHYSDAIHNDKPFTIVDTGGFADNHIEQFSDLIKEQIKIAVKEANAVILLLDGKGGISPFDQESVLTFKDIKVPVYYTVNKIDGPELEHKIYEFYSLGVEKLHPVSAEHGYGIKTLLDEIVKNFPEISDSDSKDIIKMSVLGRPNVGKSSFINRILGHKRLIVSDTPGTTRDALDTLCKFHGKDYIFIDTAGIRRKGKVEKKVEKFSIIKALKSLDRCDIALIIIDSYEGITDQDITIAGYAYEQGRAIIFLFNKWDLVEKDHNTAKLYQNRLEQAAKFLRFAPSITISALTGKRVSKIFDTAKQVYAQYTFRADTGPLNRMLTKAIEKNQPSLFRGKRLKFYYITQVSTKPPTFVLFVNFPDAVHFSYKRYLTNEIRQGIGLNKTPLRLIFRKREGKDSA